MTRLSMRRSLCCALGASLGATPWLALGSIYVLSKTCWTSSRARPLGLVTIMSDLVPWYCNAKACGGRKVLETFPGAQVWCEKGHKCSKTLKEAK